MSILSFLATLAKSLNPSLVAVPPPGIEMTGSDICYLGTNGSSVAEDVVYCKDMVDGARFGVGSWYLSPERHVIEFLTIPLLSYATLRYSLPRLARYQPPPSLFHTTNVITQKTEKNDCNLLRPPLFLRLVTLLCFSLIIYYKTHSYPKKWFYLVMPCNMNWVMGMILSFYPNLSSHAANAILQMWISMTGLAVAALAVPDTDDCVLFGEKQFFFANHAILICFPVWFLVTNKITMLPSSGKQEETHLGCFIKWSLLFSGALFSLFYFAVVSPLGIWSGLNLNYMLSPPPGADDIVYGPNYRIQSSLVVSITFVIMRFIALIGELLMRGFASLFSSLETTTTTEEKKRV